VPLTAGVLPDLSGLDKVFDYAVPPRLAGAIAVGTMVRVPLAGRTVRGWVVGLGAVPATGMALREVTDVVSRGPSPDLVDLARWGAWRWAGRLRPFLLAATPPRQVRALPARAAGGAVPYAAPAEAAVAEAIAAGGVTIVRAPPAAPRLALVEQVLAAAGDGSDTLVLAATRADAERLSELLRRRHHHVALQPEEWASAAAGGRVVVGARGAAFAPIGRPGPIVVLDAHAESYVESRAPTWSATGVVAERARRAGVPCLLASSCPTLDVLSLGRQLAVPRATERDGWPAATVLDRRDDDPRSGRYAPDLARIVRDAAGDARRPVVFVLNRTGRARHLVCRSCGEPARCESCGAAMWQPARAAAGEASSLDCPRCGASRPYLCVACGSTALAVTRVGTGRAREEVEALTGLPTAEVTAASGEPPPDALALVGTEAVLHRVHTAALVVFVDLDQEILAPRLRAAEQAMALLAAAARLVGGRRAGGRLVLQTRVPEHEVVQAVLHGDPTRVAEAEAARRLQLRLPPVTAVAQLTGAGAATFAGAIEAAGTAEVAAAAAGAYLVRAPDHSVLSDALAAAGAPTADVRIEVDPFNI
jgi:primosomal protein N' (replication factor Y)